MMLNISNMDQARKLKFSSCSSAIYKQNVSMSLRLSDIFEHGCYISALEYVRMLILSSYVLLACINAIYKYGHSISMSSLKLFLLFVTFFNNT